MRVASIPLLVGDKVTIGLILICPEESSKS